MAARGVVWQLHAHPSPCGRRAVHVQTNASAQLDHLSAGGLAPLRQ